MQPSSTFSHLFQAVLLLALFSSLMATGCKKSQPERPTPAKIHAITRELASAAHSVAAPGTQIRIGLEASDKNPGTPDSLDITLAKPPSDSAEKSEAARIQRALSTVATRHGLIAETSQSSEGALFFYLKSGVRTHTIQIRAGAAGAKRNQGGSAPQAGAKLAIILDDLGNDPHVAEEIFDLPYPLTISVLHNHGHSK